MQCSKLINFYGFSVQGSKDILIKKTLRSSILSIFILCFLFSCVLFLWSSASAEDQINVAVSILPQKYFVEKIGKDRVHVSVMVMPGASPATYEPKPRQMIDLSKADLYFAIGVPFEASWLTRFQKMNPKMRVVPTQTGVERVPMESRSHAESHADNQAESLDPHIWLSPPLVLRQAKTIRNALMKADPAGKEIYRKNYAAFETEILNLDEKIRSAFGSKKSGKAFMVYHPSWGYFARTYGLKQVPVELEGKEPSPRELVELIQKSPNRQNKVRRKELDPTHSDIK